jgi:hypothetical protein
MGEIMANLVSTWADRTVGVFSALAAVVIAALTIAGVPSQIAPHYGNLVSFLIAAGFGLYSAYRFRGTGSARKYYAHAQLSRDLYGLMITRMSERGYRTVAGYIRALIREDTRNRRGS